MLLKKEYINKALRKFPQKYLLINIISKRVEQLNHGARAAVESEGLSHLDIALKEICEGKISEGKLIYKNIREEE